MAKIDHSRRIRQRRNQERAEQETRKNKDTRRARIIKEIVRILAKHGHVFDAANELDAVKFLRREGALGRRDHGFDPAKATPFDVGYLHIAEALNHAIENGVIAVAEMEGRPCYALPSTCSEPKTMLVHVIVETEPPDLPEVPDRFAHLQPGW